MQTNTENESALTARYTESLQKFRNSHAKTQRLNKISQLATGKTLNDDFILPKPGEFYLVSATKPKMQVIDPSSKEAGPGVHKVPSQIKPTQIATESARSMQAGELKTSLTTSLRQITQTRHDMHMLTQTTRLLNVPPQRVLERNMSTGALLKSSSQSGFLLPQLSQRAHSQLHTERSVTELKNARESRQSQAHSYKVAHIVRQTSYTKKEAAPIPQIVKHQRDLLNQQSKLSPFLQEEDRILTPTPSLPLLQKQSSRLPRPHSSLRQSAQKNQQEDPKNFLTLEAYDPLYGQEHLPQLISNYCDEVTGQTLALSRWQAGESGWKECIVQQFDVKSDLFLIEWLCN